MGIYIPNEEMPKSCVKCRWYYELYDEHCTLGKFLLRKYPTDVSEEPYILDTQRHPDCPLEEVDDIAFGLYKAYIDGIEPSETPKEIVRCKECMYWHEHEWYNTCDKHIGHGFPSDYFCSDGERRNDE